MAASVGAGGSPGPDISGSGALSIRQYPIWNFTDGATAGGRNCIPGRFLLQSARPPKGERGRTVANGGEWGVQMADKLNAGDRFPSLVLNLVGGGTFAVPADLTAAYTVLLFYRGHW